MLLGTLLWELLPESQVSFSKLEKGKIIFNHKGDQVHSQDPNQQRLKYRKKKIFQETNILGQDWGGCLFKRGTTIEAKLCLFPALAVSPRVGASSSQQREQETKAYL